MGFGWIRVDKKFLYPSVHRFAFVDPRAWEEHFGDASTEKLDVKQGGRQMKRLLASTCAVALAFTATAMAEPKGTFRQAHEYGFGDQSSLDPISKGRIFQITEKLMSRLVRPDMEGKPSPDLATSWEANADATEWTLKLREGVTFHDGTAFDAADVVYSLYTGP